MLKKLLGKLTDRKYRRGIFLVVYRKKGDDIKYLILKRKLHWKGWEFPKGGKRKGESDFDTLRRELREETGLKPGSVGRYNKKGKYVYDKGAVEDRNFYGQTYILYSVQVDSMKVKLDKLEHEGHKWVDFNKAVEMLTWPNQRACLKIVNERLTRTK